MKIQSISLVAGDGGCPRQCPYCVSRMTGKDDFKDTQPLLSSKVLKALRLAELAGVSTALITGKGEPLYGEKSRSHVLQYLKWLQMHRIPFVEVQTSGYGLTDDTLDTFASSGVTTVAISCVSDSHKKNISMFGDGYEDPFDIARRIHDHGMMVRLCCVMCYGYTDTPETVGHLIKSCAVQGIEQVSFTPVTAPQVSKDLETFKQAAKLEINSGCVEFIYEQVRRRGKRLMTLVHGGEVYDVEGVSVCIHYCLTEGSEDGGLRQVIVYPNGEMRYSWTSDAARLIRGDRTFK